MKLKALLCLTLAFTAAAASASDDKGYIIDITKVDTDRYCVYDQKAYSVGAILKAGETTIECEFQRATYDGPKQGARWTKIK